MKQIAILGSTGSIGRSTLEVVRQFPKEFQVIALSTNSNIDILHKQIQEFSPRSVCVVDKPSALKLKQKIGNKTKILSGEDGLAQLCQEKAVDEVVISVTGSSALKPLLKAIDNGKKIALANKEALVMAGRLIMKRALKNKARIIPVDSEQSAIWQCLQGEDAKKLKCVYLTASGGPFRSLSSAELKNITIDQALKHPRWKMGKKITIDSATLMNKGLELLEAMYLFDLKASEIKVIIHPESIIHSMVEFVDGVILAQLSITDMCIPIQYALSYPKRLDNLLKSLDFSKIKSLNFEEPDFKKFPCLALAYNAALESGTMPCVLNAANEVCVSEFLKEKLNFMGIPSVIEKVLAKHKNIKEPDFDDILNTDSWAREEAAKLIARRLNSN